MPPPPDVAVCDDLPAAARALAEEVCRRSADAIAARGRFTIALAGGDTPAALYRELAAPALRPQVDWARWHVFFGDERCVPPDHPDSNSGMARRELLDRVPIPPAQVYRIRGEDAPAIAAADYAALLAEALAPDGRLDAVLLGIGEDGHTASLFPGAPELEERERVVTATATPHHGVRRITLTLPALNRARWVAVLAEGAAKAEAVRRALAPRPGDDTPPIARVAPVDGGVAWRLDCAAAALLPDGYPLQNVGRG